MNNGFFSRFMQGRYGSDQLNIFLAFFLIGLGVVSLFIRLDILRAVQLLIFGLFLFRFLSRNAYRRRLENQRFIKISAPVTRFFASKIRQYRDKGNRYFKCPKCSAKLRAPKNKGNLVITCPVCKHKFYKRT
ncbi:MAG: hypothetical protein CVU97_04505 [Firmicutes bacterium HGW-Firmicutes-21]|nr:MAG: hypothetical protein CVU97_04505 [Firmicutes bacterium HGW-Firmicutes-21]